MTEIHEHCGNNIANWIEVARIVPQQDRPVLSDQAVPIKALAETRFRIAAGVELIVADEAPVYGKSAKETSRARRLLDHSISKVRAGPLADFSQSQGQLHSTRTSPDDEDIKNVHRANSSNRRRINPA